jgi:hypothetical protein
LIEHCLYGAQVLASQTLFTGALAIGAGSPWDQTPVRLRRGSGAAADRYVEFVPFVSTHGRELLLQTDRPIAASVLGQAWCIEVSEVVRFSWFGGEHAVEYELLANGTPKLLCFWFVHIVLPMYLTLERGYDFIHASAIDIAGRCAVFIAPSTGGKSTLADYFLQCGHPLVSDDKVAIFDREGQYWAVPSHPHHRPYRETEVLGHPVSNFASGAMPIAAFFALEPSEPDSAIELTEVDGFRKFEELSPSYLYDFEHLRARRLQWLAGLARQLPVLRLRRPWNLQRQDEVYQAICQQLTKLRG